MSYQTIYDRLRANGLTEAGALGMLGNFDCESNCIPYRLQGDFSQHHNVSKQYTLDVDTGSISREQFAHDQKGYGLAQWTYYTRKEGLWDFWKMRGGSIGDEHLQVEFAVSELVSDYQDVLSFLRSSRDLYECVSIICRQYERPYYNNVDARFRAANRIKAEINLNPQPVPPEPPEPPVPPVPPEPPEPEPDTPTTPYWKPRMLCEGMQGADVSVLQALLQAHGYPVDITGVFDNRTKAMLLAFQGENGLAADGIAGPKSFRALGVNA